ncbi:MAG: hypothetical protein HKL80_09145 [Acidimicrobiales bacterium]|nr:hypothetical protein [Acidimicrobiales bacterium]
MKIKLYAAVLFLVALVGSACSSNSTSTSPAPRTGLLALNGVQLLAKAATFDNAAKGVHYSGVAQSTSSSANQLDVVSGDASSDAGQALSKAGTMTDQVVLMSGTAYVNGNTAALQNDIGLNAQDAAAYSGKWISFTQANSSYPSLSSSLTMSSLLPNFIPSGKLTVSGPTTYNGRQVVTVSGGLPSSANGSGATGNAKVYIAMKAPNYIVGADVSLSQAGSLLKATISFSNWNKMPNIALPPGSISCSTISSCK